MSAHLHSAGRRRTLAGIGAGVGAALAGAWQLPALAQPTEEWPVKPLRMLVPYTAGGGTDLLTRLVCEHLAGRLKQPVIVDNKPGANGVLATEQLVRSPADGYTLMVGVPSTIVINPQLYKLNYDALRDLLPLAQVATAHFVLVTAADSGINTLSELLTAARASPGRLSYASYGNGSAPHLAGVMLKSLAGADLTHVPYKGALQALPDVLAGRVNCMFDVVANVLPHIRAGRLRALAAAGHHAPPQLPQLPTIESSVPRFAVEGWVGFFAPAGLPVDIARRLSTELVGAVRLPAIRQKLMDAGFEVTGLAADAFASVVRGDYITYAKAVQAAGLKIE